jgi:nucleotide-binding universal stress UspA family protein
MAMLKIERILCPVDFSEYSVKAYDYAESLARHYDAKLFLQHVVQPLSSAYPYYPFPEAMNDVYRDLESHAQKQLEEFLKERARKGVQVEALVDRGTATESILCFAQEKTVDLIVVGTHGRRGFDRFATGSVTEGVLRKARCPVLVVRKPAHDFVKPDQKDEPVELRKILFCTDFSRHADRALDYAFLLAAEYNAELTLLHVLEDIPSSIDLQDATASVVARLEKLIPSDKQDWCTITTRVRIGKPYQEIIQLALEAQTDLVVMGVRGRSALDVALFGSTTHRVVQLGPCPVLAVHI